MWRTHHGLLGACRGAIKRERWRDRSGKEMKRERERWLRENHSQSIKEIVLKCGFNINSLSFLFSCASIEEYNETLNCMKLGDFGKTNSTKYNGQSCINRDPEP